MGKVDNISKEYIGQNEVFADLFNYAIYGGIHMVVPEDLEELDTTQILNIINKEKGYNISLQKFRDIFKLCIMKNGSDFSYILLGVENQTDINYAMPTRVMLYDALGYNSQVQEIAKENKKNKKYRGSAEFLSGVLKSDKIKPIITVVVYLGAKKWDAPRSLCDMLDIDEDNKKYMQDYKLNLIIPEEIEDFSSFRTELGSVLKFIKYSEDANEMSKLLKNDTVFHNMDHTAARLIGEVCGVNIQKEYEKDGEIDMCKAWEDMKKIVEAETAERVETNTKEKLILSMIQEGIEDDVILKISQVSKEKFQEIKNRS